MNWGRSLGANWKAQRTKRAGLGREDVEPPSLITSDCCHSRHLDHQHHRHYHVHYDSVVYCCSIIVLNTLQQISLPQFAFCNCYVSPQIVVTPLFLFLITGTDELAPIPI